MELAFAPMETSGWRGRGAPRRNVPEQILELLRRLARTDEVGIIDTRGDSDTEIAAVKAYLRAGGRQIGRRVLIQHDEDENRIRFRLAPLPKTERS